jgi:hypothetical protein
VSIPNVAALQLDIGGPRELLFYNGHDPSMITPYAEILASLTKKSNTRCLRVCGGGFDYSGVLIPALRSISLDELEFNYCEVSLDEWKHLWESIDESTIFKVRIGEDIGFEYMYEHVQATRFVADVMRTNRRILHLDFDPNSRDEDVWKSSIEPNVQRNLLASNLDKLAAENDEELRGAIVGHCSRRTATAVLHSSNS